MLHRLGELLEPLWGPARLLTSHLWLGGMGMLFSAVVTWSALPRLWRYLPSDAGRRNAVNAAKSVGKPVSAGLVFISVFLGSALLFIPLRAEILEVLLCVLAAMGVGFADDATRGLSEYTLGFCDLLVSVGAAAAISQLKPMELWVPFVKGPIRVSAVVFLVIASTVVWVSINSTNCTDGVDGLSGSLALLSLSYLGALLYVVVGNVNVARYLLVPHYPDGAVWALVSLMMIGCLVGYLWHNAPPSSVLMGDSGSRPLGLVVGVLVVATGNPALLLVVGPVLLVNGGTGLVKVALLRFLRIGIFRSVRFPLHDHVRAVWGWSDSQVILRFMLLQAFAAPLLLLLMMKVR